MRKQEESSQNRTKQISIESAQRNVKKFPFLGTLPGFRAVLPDGNAMICRRKSVIDDGKLELLPETHLKILNLEATSSVDKVLRPKSILDLTQTMDGNSRNISNQEQFSLTLMGPKSGLPVLKTRDYGDNPKKQRIVKNRAHQKQIQQSLMRKLKRDEDLIYKAVM